MEPALPEVTQLLMAWRNGDLAAREKLFPLVYEELRRLARRHMARQPPGHTLQTTALVNEACVRLLGQSHVEWQSRVHFFAFCARVMRNILVDHFRRHRPMVALDEVELASPERGVDVLALDEALDKLAALDPQKSQVVELRYFGGMTEPEIAGALGIALITVKREWGRARAWLFRELSGTGEEQNRNDA
jgi:RNA polymerase sigma factor (TIGR02999 family)